MENGHRNALHQGEWSLQSYSFKFNNFLQVCSWVLNTFFILTSKSQIYANMVNELALKPHIVAITIMTLVLTGDVEQNPGPDTDHVSLSILHLNVRIYIVSDPNRIPYTRPFSDFDILCFSETH